MKTEEFDDAIRKKVNSIYHTYKEEDIDKVHNYVQQKKTALGKAKLTKAVMISAVTVLVAALLTWNIIQLQEKKELARKVDSLENSLSQKLPVKADPLKNDNTNIKGATGLKIDANVNNSTISNVNAGTNIYNSRTTLNPERNNLNKDSNSFALEEKQTGRKNRNTEVTKHFSAGANMGKSKINTEKGRNSNAEKIDSLETPAIIKYNLTKTIDLRDSAYIMIEKNTSDTSVINKDIALADDFENSGKAGNPNRNTGKEHKPKTHHKLRYNIGLSVEKANQQAGAGLAAQVFFTDRLGIGTGLKVLNISNEKFRNIRDFYEREGIYFREAYGELLKDTGNLLGIENIHRKTTLVQIPVSVTYMLPVKNSYSIAFSGGTDIDIAAKHSIEFDRNRHNEHDKRQNISIPLATTALNNASFAVGGQKAWKHFILQANVFASPQLKKAEYKKHPIYCGLNVKALYSF